MQPTAARLAVDENTAERKARASEREEGAHARP
jgi:hypothetical protein